MEKYNTKLSDICIVVHGTINGYNVIHRTSSNLECCILSDIRRCLKMDKSVLNKEGLLLQVAPNGIWITKFQMIYVENSIGYIAFSVYEPNGYRIKGLNKILNDIKDQYFDKIKDISSENILHIDSWNFIDQFISVLKYNSIKVRKLLSYKGINQDNYVYIDDVKINNARFLKHIYQQEYANYTGIFLGNEILKDEVSQLLIKLPGLSDFEYKVVWEGLQDGINHEELPDIVCESKLGNINVTFTKENYEPQTINLKKNCVIYNDEEYIVVKCPSMIPYRKIVRINKPQNYKYLDSPKIILCCSGKYREYRNYEFMLSGEELGFDYMVRVHVTGYSDFDTTIKTKDLSQSRDALNINVKYIKTINFKFGKFINNKFYVGENLLEGSELQIEDTQLTNPIKLKAEVAIVWTIVPNNIKTIDFGNITSDNVVISDVETSNEILNKKNLQDGNLNNRKRIRRRRNIKIIIFLFVGVIIGFFLGGLVSKSYNDNCVKEGQGNNWSMYLHSKN